MGGKRCAGLGLLLAPILLLFALHASAEDQQAPQAQQALAPTIILLDGSISMWARLGGQSKVGIVRSTLTQAFTDYEDRIAFGLVAFGHRGGGACTEAELLAKPGELSAKSPGKLLFGAGFKPKATKPVAAALVEAAKQTPATGLDVVLITDGPDTCKANVCATVKSLKQAAPGLRIHVIGFDPKAKQTVKALACVAKTTGGQFLTAANANDLKQDLNAVLDAASKSAPRPVPVASTSPAPPDPAGSGASASTRACGNSGPRECPAAGQRRAERSPGQPAGTSSAACACRAKVRIAKPVRPDGASGNRPGEKCATQGTASPSIIRGDRTAGSSPDRHAEARGHSAEGKCCSGADAGCTGRPWRRAIRTGPRDLQGPAHRSRASGQNRADLARVHAAAWSERRPQARQHAS